VSGRARGDRIGIAMALLWLLAVLLVNIERLDGLTAGVSAHDQHKTAV